MNYTPEKLVSVSRYRNYFPTLEKDAQAEVRDAVKDVKEETGSAVAEAETEIRDAVTDTRSEIRDAVRDDAGNQART